MKNLPPTLRKNGFEYILLFRGRRSCLYAQRVSETKLFYEVFLLKVKPERVLDGKTLEACEIFPHSEAFGHWAWTYDNYEDAKIKFEELEK